MQPTRTCVMCRCRSDKSKLFRLVMQNNVIIYDKLQKISSRGIYFCKDIKCLEKAILVINKGKLNLKVNMDKQELLVKIGMLKNELGE